MLSRHAIVALVLTAAISGAGCEDKKDNGGAGAGGAGASGSGAGASGEGASGTGSGAGAGSSGVGASGEGGASGTSGTAGTSSTAGTLGTAGTVAGDGASGEGGGHVPMIIDCTHTEVTDEQCTACDVETGCDSPTYTDNADGTVSSSCCELVWQKAVVKIDATWEQADAYCNELDLAGGGWRLPTISELQTLIVGTTSPTIDTTYFPGTSIRDHWTSSEYNPSFAWVVTFFDGSAMGGALSNMGDVRCVR